MKLSVNRFAQDEAEAAIRYLTVEGGALLGQSWRKELQRVLQVIAINPMLGVVFEPPEATKHRTVADIHLRCYHLNRFSYTVIYRIMLDMDVLRVLAIAHQRQAPTYWLGRQ